MGNMRGKRPRIVAASVAAAVLAGCINYGDGTTAHASASAAARSVDVELADVTGDAVADPLVLTDEGRVVRMEACGTGCLARAESVGTGVVSIAVDDLDGDGVQDLVTGTATGTMAYFGGAASGPRPAGLVETDSVTVDTTTLNASVDTGDFDGDGAVDVGLFGTVDDPDFPAPRYVEAMGDGTGGFAAPVERFQALGSGLSVSLDDTGDIDGDGDDEVFFTIGVAQLSDSYIRVYGDDADDRFSVHAPDMAGGVAVGDLDGDGRDDLVVRRFSNDAFPQFPVLYWLLRSTGTGTTGFGPGGAVTTLEAAPDTTSAPGLEVADLDGDGLTDVVASDPARNRISWWHGKGDGSFTVYDGSPRVDREVGPAPGRIAVEVGASTPDLLVSDQGAANAQVTLLPNASAGA